MAVYGDRPMMISDAFFTGSSPKDRMCQLCGGRRAEHEHHVVFKGMGGRKGAAKKMIEAASNKRYICSICHSAIHLRHDITPEGFCCDRCPRLTHCFYGARMLGKPYEHLRKPF
jgi:hypothetical protein